MLDNIEILKEILLHLESYDKEVGNSDIKEFSIYLKDRVISGNEQNKVVILIKIILEITHLILR